MSPVHMLQGVPWMIRRAVLKSLCRAAMSGPPARRPPRQASPRGQGVSGQTDRPYRMDRGVAVIDVFGPTYRHSTPCDDYISYLFGGKSVDAIRSALSMALDDDAVKGIMLNVDSPGGMAAGTPELAADVRRACDSKPVATYSEAMLCSAAYYYGAAAGEMTVGTACMVGSVGTVIVAHDDSGYQEQVGIIEIPIVSSQSPDKWPDAATEHGRALYQAEVDALSVVFVSDVARYRGVDVDKVLSDFGRGGVLVGDAARKAGMVDKVGSYDDVIRKLSGPNRSRLAAARPAASLPDSQPQGTAAPLRLRLRPASPRSATR